MDKMDFWLQAMSNQAEMALTLTQRVLTEYEMLAYEKLCDMLCNYYKLIDKELKYESDEDEDDNTQSIIKPT